MKYELIVNDSFLNIKLVFRISGNVVLMMILMDIIYKLRLIINCISNSLITILNKSVIVYFRSMFMFYGKILIF
jgi:hypothetical protein